MREIRRLVRHNVPVLCDDSFIAGFHCRQVKAPLMRTDSLPKRRKMSAEIPREKPVCFLTPFALQIVPDLVWCHKGQRCLMWTSPKAVPSSPNRSPSHLLVWLQQSISLAANTGLNATSYGAFWSLVTFVMSALKKKRSLIETWGCWSVLI